MSKVFIKKNSNFSEVNSFFIKTNGVWGSITQEQFLTYLRQTVSVFGGEITSAKFEIAAPSTVAAETCQCLALYNDAVLSSGVVWTVVSGSTYGSIDNTGLLTINSTADESEIVISASYLGRTINHTIVATYKSGSSSETSTEVVVDEQGNSTTTITTVTENEDGSSYVEESVVIMDESGNTIGSSESTTTNNADGSMTSQTVNYNANGEPTDGTNVSGDTSGNVSTQSIEYDESGNTTVTGYEIDTTDSNGEGKEIEGNGVDTEFVPFKFASEGFVLTFDFESAASGQPRPQITVDTEDSGSNYLYTVLGAKTTMKVGSIWPGFEIRWTIPKNGTPDYSNPEKCTLQINRTFSGESQTTRTNFTPDHCVNNVYHMTIIYDPSDSTKFKVRNNVTNANIQTGTHLLQDNVDLDLTIGYSSDHEGNQIRHSSLIVHDFNVVKLNTGATVTLPVISCNGTEVTMSCATPGAKIYYKVSTDSKFDLYKAPIAISADTTFNAYAIFQHKVSSVVAQACEFDNGAPDVPVITYDGTYVTITCPTEGASIYYKLGENGAFTEYASPIEISETTTIYAYSQLSGISSTVVSEHCVFYDGVSDPVITCDGKYVTISCETIGSSIHYRLGTSGSFDAYTGPFAITADTIVQAYATYNSDSSATVSENCIYEATHDFSNDYLTFRANSDGTILWKCIGATDSAKTISYSVDDGQTWSAITSTASGVPITVSTGDKVLFKGTNAAYSKDKSNYSGFEGGTATYDIEGNIMSLVYGDNFIGNTGLTTGYTFCSIFKESNAVSAENLILPPTTLTNCAYRAMFSYAESLTMPPALPATGLSTDCYWYMFEKCPIESAPVLPAATLVRGCYGYMYTGCGSLNHIECLATNISASACTVGWVNGVASTGTFVKDANMTGWTVGTAGIPKGWVVSDSGAIQISDPVISCDGEAVTITCETTGTSIHYRFNGTGDYSGYTTPVTITADTTVQAYATLNGESSTTVSKSCEYLSTIPLEYSNRALGAWNYNNQEVETPYSVNAIDGHSSSMAKGTFDFETSFNLRESQPTHLWFQHADQSATVYVDNNLVEKHWGGYNAFFVDISNFVHAGANNIKVTLKNNEGSALAPSAGDFNFNATLGNVKLLTSPVLPDIKYGYDGFHVTSDVATSSATVNVETTVASGATLKCIIDDGTFYYSATTDSNGSATTFTTVISNPVLWNGKINPHLYNITLEIYLNGNLYHRFQRGYGLRFFDYAVSGTTMSGETGITYNGSDYTGFLLNGQPYFLRGVCMHDDLAGKANALNAADYAQEFAIIQELGCNFIRLAHYPHPKEVYDWCDQLGIIVQTEVPCVNQLRSTVTQDYYDHLYIQYEDMVRQHYNHPCIIFWGLFNEAQTDDTTFAKTTLEGYKDFIKAIDPSRWVGYVTSASASNPSSAFGNPDMDWFGGNIYVGWYSDKTSNNPTNQLNTRVNNIIKNLHKPYAYSEYGCGGTQHCHSENPQSTTTTGNYERHDIEYQMWLHEGHIAAIKNFPQLLFTGQWQLFDIAVTGRNEGYIICLDGETTSTDDSLRRLNDKGLVERDHITKKDTFYLYKAWWNTTDKFVHICGKDYTKKTDRVIKCYTNDANNGKLSLYVNNTFVEETTVTDNIATFTAYSFNAGDVVRVDGYETSDTFTF